MNEIWLKIYGIIGDILQLGFDGPVLKKGAADEFEVYEDDGSTKGKIVAGTGNVETLEVYDGAAQKTSITMATGGGADRALVLPGDAGASGQVLQTNGSGTLSWVDNLAASHVQAAAYDLEFDSGASVNLLNYANSTLIDKIAVVVETAFDGSNPSVEIGVSGDTDKFVASNSIRLNKVKTYIFDVMGIEASGAQMIATFTAGGGASAGSAKIITFSAVV